MQFDPSRGHSAQYIATHIARVEGEYAGKPSLQHDSLWRIASHCNLIPHRELGQQLKPEQIDIVNNFIATFKPNHHKLIAKCREAKL